MCKFALSHNGPVAIRYPNQTAPQLKIPRDKIEHGCSQLVIKGSEIAIVSVGAMLETALVVVDKLRESGYSPALYNARFVKPVDAALVQELQNYKHVFTIEDAVLQGGFGQKINPTHAFAFPDSFLETGTREELFQRYGLDAQSIVEKILQTI